MSEAMKNETSKELEDECAICYESFPVHLFAVLPCEIKLKYCPGCWDHALAAACNNTRGLGVAGGVPQCPSCRTRVKVNVEAGKGKLGETVCSLTFSRETRPSNRVNVDEEVDRISDQTRPLQIRAAIEKRHHAIRHRFKASVLITSK